MDESSTVAGADLGTIGDTDEICMAVISKLSIELFARRHHKRLKFIPSLLFHFQKGEKDERDVIVELKPDYHARFAWRQGQRLYPSTSDDSVYSLAIQSPCLLPQSPSPSTT